MAKKKNRTRGGRRAVVPSDVENYTLSEVAALLRVSIDHVYRLRMDGKGPKGFKLPGKNGAVLIPKQNFEAWKSQQAEA